MERSIIVAKGTNKALLLGHVGRDPEIRSTTGGTTVATFSLATADRQKDSQGNWSDKTEWHNLVALNRTAEVVRDYVKKGTQLFIEGKIQTRSWDDKSTGEKKYRTEILIDELTLLGGRSGGEGGSSQYGSGRAYSRSNAGGFGQSQHKMNDEYAEEGITAGDIPF
jgi:single-strand DNA-binding protein